MSIKRTIYPRPTSRLQMFKVEPRFMFDGAAAVVGAEMLMPDVPESMPVLPEVPVAEVAVPEVAPAPTTEILFIDSAVTDQTTLTANTRAGVEIVTLDAQRDPWQQMTEVIAEYQNLDTVHLVSHASAGQLMFNNESPPFAKGGWGDLSGVNVGAASTFDTAQLAQWQPHLSAAADILLYGCDLGAGTDGAQFIRQIADLTQADVAASTDATGSAALGGDWDLETRTGAIETPLAITAAGREAYRGLLADTALADSNAAAIRTTSEETEIAVTGLTVTDTDNPASMTLRVQTTGGTARIGGNNSADFTLSGSLAEVNTALATLFYTPTLDQNSSTTGFAPQIVLTATDVTNSGAAVSLTVSNFAVTAVNDAPTFTGAVAATVQEGGTVALDRAQLASSDNALDADIQTGQQVIAQLMVKVDSLPSGGTLTYKGGTVVIGSVVPVTDLGNLKYTHDGTDITANQTVSFNVTVSDGGGGSTTGVISLTVTPKNVAPTSSGSPSLIEGQVKVVAPTIALGDGFDTLANSTIVIDSINTGGQGTFFIDADGDNVVDTGEELTGTVTLTETQRTNLATQLKFFQNGAEPNAPTGISAPSYRITVTDAGGGVVGTGAAMTTVATITLTVTPNNDDPTLTNIHATPATALTIGEGTKSTVITSAMLQIADADRDPANLNNTTSPNQLVYTIGTRPTQGEIQVNVGGTVGPEGDGWIVLGDGGRFTQAQVSAGAVRYYQTTNVADGANTTDQFTFTVRDSAFGYDIWTDPANPTSGREGGLRATPTGAIALQEFDFTIKPLTASDTVRTTTYEGAPRPATSGYGGSDMTYTFAAGAMTNGNSTAVWNEANVGATDGGYIISPAMLSYTITLTDTKGTGDTGDDVSVVVPANETVYTLTSQPPNGKVQSNVSGSWTDIPTNGQFTQADIDTNNIRFVSDGSEDHVSTFDYKVSDGTPNYFNSTFGLDITPTNDRPTASGGSAQVTEGNNNAVRLGSSVIGLGDVDLSQDESKRSGEGLADFLWFKITGLAVDGSNTARGALQRWDGDSWEAVTLDTTGWLPSTLVTATADGATSGLRYVHDGSEPLAYPVNPNLTFTYLVRDDLADPNNAVATNATAPAITADTAQSNQSASATATIKIIPVNNAPQIADKPADADPTISGTITDGGVLTGINAILANVSEGGTSTITAAMLTAIDSDNTTVQRQFLIKSLPTLGTLLLNGKALGVGSTFTQADIDANKLVYKHNGAETPALITDALGSYNDKFHFTVSDAVFNDDGAGATNWNSFLITFSPMNEPPTLTAPSSTVDIDSATAANNLVTGFVVADPDLTDAVTSGETDFVQATVRLLDSASAPITNYSTGFGGAGVSFGYTTPADVTGLWKTTGGTDSILQIQGTRAQVNAALAGLSVTFANDVNANYKVQVIVDDRMRDVNGALTSGADGGTQNQAATLGDAPTAVPTTVYNWSTNAAVPANDRNIVAGSVNIRASSVNQTAILTGPATATVNEDSRTLVTTGFTVTDPESAAFDTPVTVTLSVGSGTLDVAGSGAQTTFTPSGGKAITIAGDTTATVTLTGRAADIQALLNQKNFANNAADTNGGLFFTSASNVNHDTNAGADGDVTLTLALDDVGSRIGSDVGAGSVAANPVNFTTALSITPINDAVTISRTAAAVTISGSTATAVSGFVIGDVDDTDGYATGETDFVQATVRILNSTGAPLVAANYGTDAGAYNITLNTTSTTHGATIDSALTGTNTALEVRGMLAQVNAYLAGLQLTLGSGNLDSGYSVEVVVDDRLRDANGTLTSGANGGLNNQQTNLPVVPTTDTFNPYLTTVSGYNLYNVVSNTRPLFISSVNDPAAITASNVTVNEGAATLLLDATTTGKFAIADSDDNGAANLSATVTVTAGTITAVGGAGGSVAGTGTATVTITGATEAQLNSRLQALTVSYPDPTGSATAADWNGSFTVTVVYNDNGNTGNRPGSLAAGSADANSGLFQYADGTSNILTTTRTITATVTGVNDAPVRSDATVVTLPAVAEDVAGGVGNTPPGDTVTNLFSSKFNDELDNVSGGSAANTFAGVAITTNAAIAGQGVWQYSTDGNTWTNLPAVSSASALLLKPADSLRFVPAANFHGTPGGLAARLIDSSGAAITSGTTADVADDTTKSGGTSRYSNSDNAVTLTTTVTNINDRPTASATTLTAVNEDDANPAGATVSALGFGFADLTDDQRAITGGGNAATGLGGIAIVGNAADSATQGVWQYHLNTGGNWVDIGVPADATALILPTSASLRFLPNVLNYNGAVGNLTVRVADSAQTFSASSNISGNLTGIDTWSASTTLGTAVTKQNDAPALTHTVTNPSVTENASTGAATSIDPVNLLNAGVVTDIDLTTTAGLGATTFGAGTITATLTDGIAGDVLQISGALPTSVTVAGGTGNTPLVVTLDADTTLAEVKAVLESIQYKSTSDNPTVKGIDLTRTYTVIVNDGKNTQAGGDAGSSALAAATLTGTITITAINDAPTLTDGADTAALTETDAGLSTAGTVTVNDADMDTVTATQTLAVTGTSNRADAAAPSDAALLGMLTLTPAPALNGSQTTNTLNWAFNSGTEAFNYLAAGETLVLTYTVTATDGVAPPAATTVTVTITGTNDLPDITVGAGNSAAAALTETDTALSANGTLRVDDVDTFNTVAPSVISVVATGTTASLGSNNAALLAMLTVDTVAVISDNANTGTINWVFNSGAEKFDYLTGAETLTLTYTVRATDSSAGTDDQTIVITISSSTDAPVLTVVPPANVDELADASAQDLSLSGNLQVFDKDVGNTLTPSQAAPTVTWSGGGTLPTGVDVSALTAANVLVLGGAATSTGATLNISWTYDPAAADLDWLAVGETLAISYPLTVTDGTGGTDTKPLVITIAGTNDAPVITDGADTAALTETNATLTASSTMTVIDRDLTNTTTLTVDSVATGGTFAGTNPLTNAQLKAMLSLTAGAVASDPGASGNLSWTFTSGASGNGAFDFLGTGETLILTYTVKATDTALATDTDTVTVTITGTNDTPVAAVDVAATTEDTPITILAANLLGNDTDAEGNSISIAAVTSGIGGTAVLNGDGSVTFTPTADFNGAATFSYTVNDGSATSAPATVTVNVTAVADAVNDALTTNENIPFTINVITGNAGAGADHFENPVRTISAVTNGSGGTVQIADAALGTLIYTPRSGFSGTDSFTYTVTSPAGVTETATVNVTVIANPAPAPSNHPPVANADALATTEDFPITFAALDLLSNDVDPNGNVIRIASVTSGTGGTAVLNGDGSVTFTPNADFNGMADFSYIATDNMLPSNSATVMVTVNPVIDIVNDNLTTNQATPITANLLTNDSFENSNRVISAVTQGANGRVEIINAATGEVKYTPNSDFSGTDTYTYTVTSPITGITETATVTVTVNAPTAINATGNEDAAINGTLTGAIFVIADQPNHGTATIDAAGKWIYTPTADFNGADQFTVTVTDAAGNKTTQLIQLTVNPVIDVVNDRLTTNQATPITANLLKNDSFENSNRMISAVTQGANGRVEIINAATGEVKYTPNSDFSGTDTYTYTVTSPITGITETATVTVTVNAPNTATATGNEDTVINGTLTGAIFVIADQPNHGTATIDAAGKWIYTPTADFNGADQFTVTVTDAAGNKTTQLIQLTVNPVIDVVNDRLTTNQATPITANLLKNDSFENSNRMISAVTQGANGRVEIINAATGEVKYTPNSDFSGTDTYTYTVTSPITGITETATVTVTVNAPNTATATGNEDTVINGTLTGAIFVIADQPNHGTATIDAAGKWIYTPTADFNGADQFSVTVTDDAGNKTTQLIQLTVNPVIDVVNDRLTTTQATPITANLLKNDSFENSNRVISAVTQGTNGRVEIVNAATGEVKYTPNSDFTGTDTYTYTVTSPITGITETATVTVTVNAPNIPNTTTAIGNEDTVINGTLTGAIFVIADQPNHGTATIDAAGKWIYMPTADFNGADQFTVTVTDTAGNKTTQLIQLTVNPVIDVVNDRLTTNQATPITANLLKNDSFENSNRMISAVTQGANGRVEIINAATGEVKYTPNSDFTGTDTYTYTVTSPITGITETATVTVTVNAPNTATATGNEDTVINGTLTGAIFVIADQPNHGTAAIDATGKWIYTPTADFNGVDQFSVTVSDAAGNQTTQLIQLTVNPVIDVVNDRLTTNQATPITANLLKNDSFENSNRMISAVTQGANGRVEIINAATGEVKYTPNSDFTGTDTYTYTVTSPITGITETATVTVTVNAPNTTTATGNEDTVINGTLTGAIFVIADQPNHGTATIDAAGKWIYMPTADFNGADQFSVTVSDAAGNKTTQLIQLTVNPVIDVVNDRLTTNQATPITANLLKNDSFENSNRMISAVTQGTNGRVEIINAATGEVKYTPNSDFSGTDTYTYTVTSPITGITETATVTVTVNAPNTATATGNEDTVINGTLTGAIFVIADQPNHGTATIDAAGKWIYMPTADFNGADQFSVTVSDAAGNQTTQLIQLTVNPVIDVVNDRLTTNQATPITANLLKNDSFENSNRMISAVTQGANGRVEIINAATGEVKYTPNSDFSGTDTYTYTVTSPITGITETATVTVTVNAPNTATATGNEDTVINGTLTGAIFVIADQPNHGTATIDAAGKWIYMPTADFNGADQFSVTVSDAAGNKTTQLIQLTVNPVIDVVNDRLTTNQATPITANLLKNDSFENSNRMISAVTQGANGRVEIVNAATGEVKYTPNSDFVGTDTYTYTVTSPIIGITETATVTVTVNAPNTATATGNEDTVINGTLTGAIFVIADQPNHGTATIDAAGKWIYTPTADFNGADQFTVTVTDAAGNKTTQLIQLTVNPVIDVVNDRLTTNQATPITANLLKNDSFENSNRMISAVTQGTNGRVEIINAATGEVKYTPNSDFSGTDTYTYTVTSPITGITETATVTVTVNAPTAINATGNEDAAINGTLTGTKFVIADQPNHGTAAIDATGKWIYTPTADFNGADQFSVTVTDAAGNQTTQLIQLTVNPVIDVVNDRLTTNQATPITANLLKNDSFENSNRVISAVTQGANGRVEIINAATGEVKYTPNSDFSGTDTYTYTVTSPITGITETATVTVTVNVVADQNLTVIGQETISEGNNAIFKVTLDTVSLDATPITLTLSAGGDDAILGTDYRQTPTVYYFADDTKTTLPVTDNQLNLPAGVTTFFVNVSTINDTDYEGGERLTLTATLIDGKQDADIATILDDSTGLVYDEQGAVDPNGVADDDRLLSIPDVTVNESTPYAVFRVNASSNQLFSLELLDGGTEFTVGDAVATAGADYGNSLEVYDGTTWIPYTPNALIKVPEGGRALLVRVPIFNDAAYEGAHAFTLAATLAGSTVPITGRGIIGDFGTGAIFNDSGVENRLALKDDDRSIKIDSPIINEGSEFVVFTINGTSGVLDLALQLGSTPSAATIPNGIDNIQFWDGAEWRVYDGTNAAIPAAGTLLVRVGITAEQDELREGSETFDLIAIRQDENSLGKATLRDDGTGVINVFAVDDGAYRGTTIINLDDDFDQDGITPTTEEALATLAASQGIGDAEIGDLNHDGKQDAEQNALATLAWTTKEYFNAGNDGTLTESKAIVSIGVVESMTSDAISPISQLLDIHVEHYADIDATTEVVDNGTSKTVTLANGSTVTTPWDPIRFGIRGQDVDYNGSVDTSLADILSDRAGLQVRVLIDVRAARVTTAEMNAYIKYVSAEAIAAAAIVDLDGNAITAPGWYDFTRRDPTSNHDGARFIVEGAQIVSIELIFTDNAFGDDDMTAGRIFDPGVPVYAEPVPTPELLPMIQVVNPQMLEYTQPIFPAATVVRFDTLSMVPAAYVLNEVDNVRNYGKAAALRNLTTPISAEHILYVLPAVNRSQTESLWFDQTALKERLGSPEQKSVRTTQEQVKAPATHGKEPAKSQVKPAPQDAAPPPKPVVTDGAEDGNQRTDQQEVQDAQPADHQAIESEQPSEQKTTRVNFSDQLRFAARDRSLAQQARSLGGR